MIKNARKLMMIATALTALPVASAAQQACSSYTVKAGDSMGSIAEAAFGSFDYQMIFNANRNVIGGNPNDLEEGIVLQIPCEDGSLSTEGSAEEVIAEQEEIQAKKKKASNTFEPPIKLVSGNGWEPFTSENLNGGGMLVRIATTALNRGGNSRDYNISYVDDWASHMDTLLPLGAFDVSIAWTEPDCANFDNLDDEGQRRCRELDFSLPIYETVTAYWSLPDNDYADVKSFADYAGAKICRPEGWSTDDLTVEGLVPPIIEYVRPAESVDCIAALLDGSADMVSLDLESGNAAIAQVPDAVGVVQPNPNLSKLEALQFVTHKTNPRGRVYIAMLNKGLTEMRETGEWYAIVSSSLSEYNTQNLGQ